MASAQELERLVVRLVGEGSDYEKVLDDAVAQTEQAAKQIGALTETEMAAHNAAMEEAARITQAVATPTEKYAKELEELERLYKGGQLGQQAYNRAVKQATQGLPSVQAAQAKYNKEVARAKDITNAARTPTERYRSKIAELDRLHKKGMISAQTHARSVKALNKEFTKGGHAVAAYGKKISAVGAKMKSVGTGMTIGLTLPIVAAGVGMVKAASDAEETQNKFNVVFSSVGASATKMAQELDDAYGLSAGESKELLANTTDLLSGFGFTQKAGLQLSGEVQKLAVDLASFTNFAGGAKGASEALTKALLGERESAKALGIAILEADVVQRVMENNAKGVTFETERQAKAFATLQIAQEQSKNAIGDYARSQDSFANQTRELWADVKDLAVAFGQVLMPVAKQVLAWVRQGITWIKGLSDGWKRMIAITLAVVAGLGPVIAIIGTIVAAVGGLVTIIGGFIAVGWEVVAIAAAVVAGLLLWVAQIVAVGYAIFQLIEYIWGPGSVMEAINAVIETGKKWMFMFIGFIMNISHNFKVFMEWLPRNWQNLVKDMIAIFFSFIRNGISNFQVFVTTIIRLGALFQGYMIGVFKKVFSIEFLKWVWDGIKQAAKAIFDFAKAAWKGLKSIFTGGGKKDDLAKLAKKVTNDFEKGMESKNIIADAAAIVKEQSKELKGPLDGFKSSIEEIPEFSFEIGGQAGKKLVDGMADATEQAAGGGGVFDPIAAKLAKDIGELEQKMKGQIETFGKSGNALAIWKLQQRGATEAQLEAVRAAEKQLQVLEAGKIVEKMQEQIKTFGLTGRALEIYKLQQMGATAEQIKAAKAADKRLTMMEREKKLTEDAKSLMKKHRTPLAKLTEERAKLNEMLEKNLIDLDTFTAAMKEAEEQFKKEMKIKISIGGVDAVEAGTAEAEQRLRDFRALAGEVKVPGVKGPGGAVAGGVAAGGVVAGAFVPKPPSEKKEQEVIEDFLAMIEENTRRDNDIIEISAPGLGTGGGA